LGTHATAAREDSVGRDQETRGRDVWRGRTTAPSQPDGFRACLFELAGQRFGLRLESVSEIVPMAALSRPPCMPSILEGFLNLRGTALPVLRIASLLGLPQAPFELHTPLIIVRGGAPPLALLVDRVTGVVSLPFDGLVPLVKSDSFNGCIDGGLTSEGGAVHLLALDRLLLEKERQILAEFHATETRRLRQID
jgi:purine-binding chemotaxis protein CheW